MSVASLPLDREPAAERGPIEVHVTFETTLGLLAAFFIGFFAPVAGAIFVLVGVAKQRPMLAAAALLMTIVSGRAAIMIAKMAAQASMGWLGGPPPATAPTEHPRKQIPFALAMAALLPHSSWLYRPVLATWWLAHFCGAAAFGHTVAMNLIQKLDAATAVLALPLAVVVHFAFLFASNLYLVLAARAILRSPRFCVRVWRYRFVIDFIIAAALVLFSRK